MFTENRFPVFSVTKSFALASCKAEVRQSLKTRSSDCQGDEDQVVYIFVIYLFNVITFLKI
jgi:hypothetical protein